LDPRNTLVYQYWSRYAIMLIIYRARCLRLYDFGLIATYDKREDCDETSARLLLTSVKSVTLNFGVRLPVNDRWLISPRIECSYQFVLSSTELHCPVSIHADAFN
jgi:hypothetical protein